MINAGYYYTRLNYQVRIIQNPGKSDGIPCYLPRAGI